METIFTMLAQEVEAPTFTSLGAFYFIAIIAGIILALAFQLILTNLSFAAGLNLAKLRRGPGDGSAAPGAGLQTTARKITHGFGAWTLVTAAIALFFASWLGVELARTSSYLVGMVLGLVIWGVFYIILMTFEITAVTSTVGSLIGITKAGLKAAYDATTGIFTKSPEARVADSAREIAGAVREELFEHVDVDDLKKTINSYIKQLKPAQFTPENFRTELAKLLNDTEIRAVTEFQGPLFEQETLVAHLQTKGGLTKEKAQSMAGQVQEAFSRIKDEYGKGEKGKVEKAADAAMRASGLSEEDAAAWRHKVEDYLRSTGKDELQPEAIRGTLETLLSHPQAGVEQMKQHLAGFDRSTIVALLAQRKDMNQDEAQRLVDRIISVFQSITGKAAQGKEAGVQQMGALRDSILGKIANYLNSLNRPELRYEEVKDDLVKLFHDPKAGADALLQRARSMDRDTLRALIASSREDMSEEDAENLLRRMESARDRFIDKLQDVKLEAQHKIEQARDEVIRQADETRKTAAIAAWWSFGTAAAAGIAAALGGIIAVAS